MTRPLQNISASVEQRLKNITLKSGEDHQYLLMRYGLERLMLQVESVRLCTAICGQGSDVA